MSLLAEPSDAVLPSTNNVRYTVCRLPKAEMTGSMQTEHIGAATFAVGTPVVCTLVVFLCLTRSKDGVEVTENKNRNTLRSS